MARQTFVFRNGKMVPKHLAGPPPAAGRRFGNGPMIITDAYALNPVRSVVDGTVIASRADLRAHNRRNGVEDVGNDPHYVSPPQRRSYEPQGVEEDVARVLDETGPAEDITAALEQVGIK